MPTIGSITKTIRIAPRDLEVIEGLMKDGTSWSGAIHKLCAGENSSKAGTPTRNEEILKGKLNILRTRCMESARDAFDNEQWGLLKIVGAGTPSKNDENSVLSHDKWGIDEKDLEDLDTMSRFMGGSVGEMIHLFDLAVNEGILNYENGRYVGVPDLNLDYFKDACHSINREPQEMLDKVTTMIEKGRI